VHAAAAERLQADVLLTCDDQLLRIALQHAADVQVRIANPIDWVKEHFDATNTG
jgi:hypothetical protein